MKQPGHVIAANRAMAVFLDDCDPALLKPPINLLRLMLHPDGMAPRVANLGQWGRHVVENLRALAVQSPDSGVEQLIEELTGYVPDELASRDYNGFAVPLRLASSNGELRLLTALTSFATAVDVTVAEVMLESFLPADAATAEILAERDRRAEQRGETRLLALGR